MLDNWQNGTLDDAGRDLFYRAALDKRESSEKDIQAVRTMGITFGIGGVLVGLLGMGYGLVAQIRVPKPEPPRYVLVHDASGQIDAPLIASDAPLIFTEATRRKALRDLLISCESYVPQTWAKLDYHACMIQLEPAEQKRRAADIGQNAPRYPVTVFGPTGWAMPTGFPATGFILRGSTGNATDQVWHYQVRYERTEVANGNETRPHYTADITFGFHPERQISAADVLINPSGLQVIAFSTTKD